MPIEPTDQQAIYEDLVGIRLKEWINNPIEPPEGLAQAEGFMDGMRDGADALMLVLQDPEGQESMKAAAAQAMQTAGQGGNVDHNLGVFCMSLAMLGFDQALQAALQHPKLKTYAKPE